MLRLKFISVSKMDPVVYCRDGMVYVEYIHPSNKVISLRQRSDTQFKNV